MGLHQAKCSYLESLKSVDEFTCGQGGKIRFNKINQRGALDRDEDVGVRWRCQMEQDQSDLSRRRSRP
ncbi:MAG: hypothetical protein J3Q66DRAFT_440315 [Benniella sp.]|nr:MAG: hypothetical protein J3Q66DRAFT_440315 [Benniella sp.]